MDNDPDNLLQAIRQMGETWEKFLTLNVTNGEREKLSADDIKNTAVVAFMMMTELKNRMDAYETKSANEWMSVAEAAAVACCSKRTIHRTIEKGELVSKKVNGHRVIQRQSLDRFAQYRTLFSE